MISKNIIRKELRNKLFEQSIAQRLRKSCLIKERLFSLAEFTAAKLVMFYLSTDKEVATDLMVVAAQETGKKIAVPVVITEEKRMIASLIEDFNQELYLGPYGIFQPQKESIREIPAEKIDLVIVPGLAFDKQGHRLGRGGGYYDKFLTGLKKNTPSIGLAFDFQVLDTLPVSSHDIMVTKVISA